MHYTWNNGVITGVADNTHPQLEQIFQYDNLDRLTQNNAAGVVYQYTYDANGNRLSRTNGSTSYSYTNDTVSNKLMSIYKLDSFSYDAAGNQVHATGITNQYDNAGRLTYTNKSGVGASSYRYNALGQRLQKVSPTATTRFVYDEAGHLLGEYTATGTPIQETVYLGDWPVATVRTVSNVATAYYVWPDHLGTPRQVTDPVSKLVLWRWDSEAFGDATPNQDPQGSGNTFVYNLRFPGQYWDAEVARAYNNARDYSPFHGRYIESDPIGLNGGSYSTFGYVGSNPVSFYDPLGLAAAGHHVFPQSLWRNQEFPPAVKQAFDKATIQPAGRHGWSRAHSAYNQRARGVYENFCKQNGIDSPSKMTTQQAQNLIKELTNDPALKTYNDGQMGPPRGSADAPMAEMPPVEPVAAPPGAMPYIEPYSEPVVPEELPVVELPLL